MSQQRHAELPPEKRDAMRRATRLQWISLAYMASAVVVVGLTLGQSQAMKAAWAEDILSLLPPIAFLVAARVRHRPPDAGHPWGWHRITSLAFLTAALALLVFGLFVLGDSLMKLAKAERPPVGVMQLFGHEIWAGWLMLGALAYSGLPPVLLGRIKRRLAAELHDKVLYADAEMNRADWMTAGAAAIGVVGIGFGIWFADAATGALIALDVTRDGWRNVRAAGNELMDARPTTYDLARPHPATARAEDLLQHLPWVREVDVRLREEGHVFAGEARVVPADDVDLTHRLQRAADRLLNSEWKLHDVLVVPVTGAALGRAPDAPGGEYPGDAPGRRPAVMKSVERSGLIDGLCELTLEVRDLERARRFYCELLGLDELQRDDDRVWLRVCDAVRLGLWLPGDKEFGDEGGEHVHFALSASGGALDVLCDRLTDAGHDVHGPVEHDGGDRSIYFEDPDGNVVEVWDFLNHGEGARRGMRALNAHE